jgi:O-antigen ligase
VRHDRASLLGETLMATVAPVIAAVSLTAVAAWMITSGRGSTLTAGAIVVIGGAAILRWPALAILGLLIVCQELNPAQGFGGASGSGLLFIGYQLFFKTVARVSLLTLTVAICSARIAVTAPPRRPAKVAAVLVLIMGGYYTALLYLDGTSVTSAINQDSRFALLFGACFIIGAWARSAPDWRRNAIPVLQWLFTVMALLGAYLTATGQGQAETGANLIFYDSALGAIAGAIVIAAVLTPPAARTWRIWWLGGAALVVVVLSSRRNVWAGMIVALLIGLVFARHRARLVLRGLSVLVLLLVLAELFLPAVTAEIGHQLSAIWAATQGSAADASVQGHLSDVSIGWHAVTASPLSGVGPNGHVAGLVVQGPGPLYIHNQELESWLRFGLAGALMVIAVQLVLIVQSVGALRRSPGDFTVSWAAYLLLIAPVSMLTAPFFTNTQRWPAIIGFAAGLVAARSGSSSGLVG